MTIACFVIKRFVRGVPHGLRLVVWDREDWRFTGASFSVGGFSGKHFLWYRMEYLTWAKRSTRYRKQR
eukprot:g65108.t1